MIVELRVLFDNLHFKLYSEDILDMMEGDIRDKIVLDLGMEHVPDADHVCDVQC